MLGETISHYRIVEKLGQGGMGEVWLAEDVRLGHRVAIKLLPANVATEEKARRRFLREAQSIAELRHPAIVPLLEFDEVDGRLVLITEYEPGGSLQGQTRQGPLPLDKVLRWGVQIAEGLEQAHRHGVLHRDIKPGNLLLTEDGDAKIADFGLALFGDATRMTEAGAMLGTLGYAAPEQVRGEDVDVRGDLFSLGATLYELVAGRAAFPGTSAMALLRAMLDDTPDPLTGLRNDVPQSLQELFDELLDKDPAKRPRSAGEVATRLRAIAMESGIDATMPMPVASVPDRGKAHVRWGVAITTAAVAAAAVLGFWSMLPNEPAHESLAVLPLDDLSGQAGQEYLAAGMTEALIQEFGKVQALKVVSHQSVRRYADTDLPTPQIAGELGVTMILEGSVMRVEDQIRISLRVIDAPDDRLIANREFDGKLENIFDLYSQAARSIVDDMRVSATPEERTRMTSTKPVEPAAYEAYLRGREARARWGKENLLRAIDYFEQAAALDSTFALPHAAIASILSQGTVPGWFTIDEVTDRARSAAARALEIDPDVAETHSSLGLIAYFWDWEFEAAERHFLRSLDLNPNSSDVRTEYSVFLVYANRSDEGLREMRRVVELDPLSLFRRANLGWALIQDRRYDETVENLRTCLETFDSFPDPVSQSGLHYLIALALRRSGRLEEALDEVERFNVEYERQILYATIGRFDEAHALSREPQGWIYAMAGEREKALACIAEFERRFEAGDSDVTMDIARVYALLGDRDPAFEWLEKAYELRAHWLLQLPWTWTFWDDLRDDPRYADLISRMHAGKSGHG